MPPPRQEEEEEVGGFADLSDEEVEGFGSDNDNGGEASEAKTQSPTPKVAKAKSPSTKQAQKAMDQVATEWSTGGADVVRALWSTFVPQQRFIFADCCNITYPTHTYFSHGLQ